MYHVHSDHDENDEDVVPRTSAKHDAPSIPEWTTVIGCGGDYNPTHYSYHHCCCSNQVSFVASGRLRPNKYDSGDSNDDCCCCGGGCCGDW